eukprot:3252352-Pyramimonas_sp.AAC.1
MVDAVSAGRELAGAKDTLVQRYIPSFEIHGRKMSLRLYVVVYRTCPKLCMYIANEGLVVLEPGDNEALEAAEEREEAFSLSTLRDFLNENGASYKNLWASIKRTVAACFIKAHPWLYMSFGTSWERGKWSPDVHHKRGATLLPKRGVPPKLSGEPRSLGAGYAAFAWWGPSRGPDPAGGCL